MAIHDSTDNDFIDGEEDNGGTLKPQKHPQRDFFIADIVNASFKDDLASMEYPLFALKAGDTKVRTFNRNGVSVTIKPTADGIATIFDKDVWIYCISQMVEAMNRGKEISRTVRFTAYDFLISTNRDTGSKAYKMLEKSLARLKGRTLETNIETDGKRQRNWFGLLDSAEIIEDDNNKMIALEITLSDWLYRSVTSRSVLTLSPEYFRIRKPLRMSNVTVIVTQGQRQASCHMMSYAIDEADGKLAIALNPRISAAILGSGSFTSISMDEVRRLKTDAARLIHQRLCGRYAPT